MLRELKEEVWKANQDLVALGLVTITWGNVSGLDRKRGLVAIKPSGITYEQLKPSHIVLVDLEGREVEGKLSPSSDTPTHLELYKAFTGIGAVAHTHSEYAAMFAQAALEIP
jgi:L-ribulose-5-phosphate 4-epimerase